MEETNIEAVKNVAIQFLYQEPELIPDFDDKHVMHPYLEYRTAMLNEPDGIMEYPGVIKMLQILGYPCTTTQREPDEATEEFDIFKDKEKYKKWQRQMVDKINRRKSWEGIFHKIRKPYRLAFFEAVNTFLSSKDFAEMLISCWTEIEFISDETNVSKEEMVSWFEQADKKYLMDEDEQETLKKMPDQIKVYRGVGEPQYKNGFSWTVNFETAEFFAKRFKENADKIYIYECTISKDDILCYTDARDEAEVIINPKVLKKYQIKEMDV